MKHIESIQPEYAAEELERIVREEGDATATAALTALLHNVTGCDIPQTDTTPQSEVEELVPLAVSILRRHWQTPLTALGDGTTPMSLADLMRRLIGDRVQGNEALCIPPANDNIPHAVAALRERKIGGVPELPDGLSFARIFCDSTIPPITELIDDNIGWGVMKYVNFMGILPSLTRVQINCTSIVNRMYDMPTLEYFSMPYLERSTDYKGMFYNSFVATTELDFPSLDYISFGSNFTPCIQNCKMRTFKAEKLRIVRSNGTNSPCFYDCPNLEEIILPNLQYCNHYGIETKGGGLANKCPNLRKVVVGDLSDTTITQYGGSSGNGLGFVDCPNLIHLEIGQGTSVSLDMRWWTPTTALADNLPLFLSNFRQYIADRLSDNGSGKTLTLSQEVRDAIHSAGIDTIITNKGWTISPVPTQQ